MMAVRQFQRDFLTMLPRNMRAVRVVIPLAGNYTALKIMCVPREQSNSLHSNYSYRTPYYYCRIVSFFSIPRFPRR